MKDTVKKVDFDNIKKYLPHGSRIIDILNFIAIFNKYKIIIYDSSNAKDVLYIGYFMEAPVKYIFNTIDRVEFVDEDETLIIYICDKINRDGFNKYYSKYRRDNE